MTGQDQQNWWPASARSRGAGSRMTPPALGTLAGGRNDVPQRSPLTLDHGGPAPHLLRWSHRRLDLDPHPVQVGQKGSVLLPGRTIRSRLLVQELGKLVTAVVQLQKPSVNLRSGDVGGVGARGDH